MTLATAIAAQPTRRAVKYRSRSNDRKWALRWAYFFLSLFVIFFLMPPVLLTDWHHNWHIKLTQLGAIASFLFLIAGSVPASHLRLKT